MRQHGVYELLLWRVLVGICVEWELLPVRKPGTAATVAMASAAVATVEPVALAASAGAAAMGAAAAAS